MKNLQNILEIIGTKNFNDLIATYISGDIEWVSDSLIEQSDITSGSNYIEKLCQEHGYTHKNFPWVELSEYCNKVSEHLKTNLILPI
jgi:hypothetical protein